MNKRQIKIIELLLQNEEYKPIHEWAEKLKVSEKTLHRDIEKINLLTFLSSRVMFFDEIVKAKDMIIELDIETEFNVLINSYELERIVDNTVSNAIKYGYKESEIVIALLKEKENYILEISNLGDKIKDTSSIFEKYYQEKKLNVGLGLGLNIVKTICDKYEIKTEVYSEDITKFRYYFPKNMIEELFLMYILEKVTME